MSSNFLHLKKEKCTTPTPGEWIKGETPPECGYYLAAWKPQPPSLPIVSELWFNPTNGWWASRGYLDVRTRQHWPFTGVYAWMELPKAPTP